MSVSKTHDGVAQVWPAPRASSPSLFRWTHGLINRLVIGGDILALPIGAVIAGWLGLCGQVPLSDAQLVLLAAGQAVMFVAVLKLVGAYRVENYARLGVSLAGIGFGLLGASAICAGFIAVFAPALLATTPWLIALPIVQLAALVALRLGAWVAVGRIGALGLMRRNAIVVGCGAEAEAMVARLAEPAQAAHCHVVGVVSDQDAAAPGLFAGRKLLGGLRDLAAIPGRDAIDLVVIATPPSRAARLPHIVDALQYLSCDVVLSLDAATAPMADAALPRIAGQPVLPLMYRPLKGSQALVKAIEDRVIAAIALAIISPLLLLVALAIRLDSPGPALFRQDRIGLYNRTFRIFKFRTMTVDPSDDGARGTNSRHNPRITRVGGVLRSLSLDELPQLINVLLGDMSIVGPRPYVRNMLVEDQTFETVARSFAARHRMKPGITGLAQASGLRSNALRSRGNAVRSVQLDMDYIANWSLWLDFRIMFRTVAFAMRGPEVF